MRDHYRLLCVSSIIDNILEYAKDSTLKLLTLSEYAGMTSTSISSEAITDKHAIKMIIE